MGKVTRTQTKKTVVVPKDESASTAELDEVKLPSTVEDEVARIEEMEEKARLEAAVPEMVDNVSTESSGVISLDTSVAQVLQLNDQGEDLIFDHTRFLRLPQTALDRLSETNRTAYFVALGMSTQLANDRAVRQSAPRMITDPFSKGRYRKMMDRKMRARPGWHVTLKEPGEIDGAKMNGYVFVRSPTEEQLKDGYKVGEEAGEILFVKNQDGTKVDAYVMEIPAHIYEQHLEAMSQASQARLYSYPDKVQENISQSVGTEVKVLSGDRPNDRDYMTEVDKKSSGAVKDFYMGSN